MLKKGSEVIDVEVTMLREIEKAFLLTSIETKKTNWFPKFMIDIEQETAGEVKYDKNLNVIVNYIATIPTWLAEKNGFI